ncbi:MAG TPA: D-alanyl-D-alanine carboxypeptidase family protein [Candidatus Paceibacterota bacterium]|nr:D-alanyl-D-alanine carboxypeptidase family protein [Candidatus Paceibacterota bacterium]
MDHQHPAPLSPFALAIILVLLIAAGGGGYWGYTQYTTQVTAYDAQVATLESQLADASSTNQQLSDALSAEQARNADFQNQISKLTSQVGTLNKLASTDPQLLAKYSKVYFLNENYVPASLEDIPSRYTYPDDKDYQFLTSALPRLEQLMDAAKRDHVDLEVLSAYRSFSDQASLKSEYKVTYGSGANAFSADQGYSEHQLGTAIDFTTESLNGTLDGFDKTDAYTWLTKNAYRYGFILSYPPGNSFYVFEPWHWRFVGKTLAIQLHNDDEYFYDMDQRDINTYLVDFPN